MCLMTHMKAYGSAIYQRSICKISANLIMSKSEVAPLQATSIPRLDSSVIVSMYFGGFGKGVEDSSHL